MAAVNNKVEKNVAGEYYVDAECIACGLCVTQAPENFKMTDDSSYAFVYKQPENEEEREVCDEVLGSCPVDAIGNDG